MKHFSHFIAPGADFIEALSFAGYEDILAFRNPDRSYIFVVQNPMAQPMPIHVAVLDKELRATLPADSFSTFRVTPTG